jgi:curved DNA-binding protein CbpA
MKTPFDILEVQESASDAEIKAAYLRMVRQYPPDRFPDRFKEIKQAYDAIKSLKDRLAFSLFNVPEPDLDALFMSALKKEKKRINAEVLLKIVLNQTYEEIKRIKF